MLDENPPPIKTATATRSARGRPVRTGQLDLYVSNGFVSIRGTGQPVPPQWDEATAARMLLDHDALLAAAEAGLSFMRHALEFFGWGAFPNLQAEVERKRDMIAAHIANAKAAPLDAGDLDIPTVDEMFPREVANG
jgi:hypothetical protein